MFMRMVLHYNTLQSCKPHEPHDFVRHNEFFIMMWSLWRPLHPFYYNLFYLLCSFDVSTLWCIYSPRQKPHNNPLASLLWSKYVCNAMVVVSWVKFMLKVMSEWCHKHRLVEYQDTIASLVNAPFVIMCSKVSVCFSLKYCLFFQIFPIIYFTHIHWYSYCMNCKSMCNLDITYIPHRLVLLPCSPQIFKRGVAA